MGFLNQGIRKGMHFPAFASLLLVFGSPLPVAVSDAGLLHFQEHGLFVKDTRGIRSHW